MHQKKALKQSLTASLEINNANNIGHKPRELKRLRGLPHMMSEESE